MLITLISITLLLHALLTAGSLLTWKKVLKDNPQLLPKLFFTTSAIRLVASVALFAISLLLIRQDIEQVKIFTIVVIATYLLLLTFDTAYFYHSSKTIDNSNS